MKTKHYLEQWAAEDLAYGIWMVIANLWKEMPKDHSFQLPKVYGVPRGGVNAAYLILAKTYNGVE